MPDFKELIYSSSNDGWQKEVFDFEQFLHGIDISGLSNNVWLLIIPGAIKKVVQRKCVRTVRASIPDFTVRFIL